MTPTKPVAGARDKTLVIGTFDAERLWRDPGLSRLPGLGDEAADRVVAVMDELLFVFCRPGDLLATRRELEPSLLQYLRGLGVTFEHLALPERAGAALTTQRCIFDTLCDLGSRGADLSPLASCRAMEAWAVMPATRRLCELLDLPVRLPEFEVVRRVNSKAYHYQVCAALGIDVPGVVVGSAEELERHGRSRLEPAGVVLKEVHGVSGKGSITVSSPRMLGRIVDHVARQEAAGRESCFIVEPRLDRVVDLSCQVRLDPDGAAERISVRRLDNNGATFLGSAPAGAALLATLEERGYFETIERLSRRLAADGYFGHVCVDSMLLRDGRLVPVVEINARMSMGLIAATLERRLSLPGAYLTVLPFGLPPGSRVGGLLDGLEAIGLLYQTGRSEGIIPLALGPLLVNRMASRGMGSEAGRIDKGRFYYAVVAERDERRAELMAATSRFFVARGFGHGNDPGEGG